MSLTAIMPSPPMLSSPTPTPPAPVIAMIWGWIVGPASVAVIDSVPVSSVTIESWIKARVLAGSLVPARSKPIRLMAIATPKPLLPP